MSEQIYQKFGGSLKGFQARDEIILGNLRKELIGPAPAGKPLVINESIKFSKEDSYKNWVVADTGEEIIKEYPVVRYGAGALYTKNSKEDNKEARSNLDDLTSNQGMESLSTEESSFVNTDGTSETEQSDEGYDFDLSLANERLPQSFAISFVCNFSQLKFFKVKITGGIYKPFNIITIDNDNKKTKWWYRTEVAQDLDIKGDWNDQVLKKELIQEAHPLYESGLRLTLRGCLRKLRDGNDLITISLVNESSVNSFEYQNMCTFFQAYLQLDLEKLNGLGGVLPYPEPENLSQNEEVLINQLLYRDDPIFAVGHGCAANWKAKIGEGAKSVKTIMIDTMPTFEVPSITPDIKTSSGKNLAVSMKECSTIYVNPNNNGYMQLKEVVQSYGSWIADQSKRVNHGEIVDHLLVDTAKKNLTICQEAYERMRVGLELLESDAKVQKAFSLMNHAMLLQQEHVPKKIRKVKINKELGALEGFSPSSTKNDDIKAEWRAFQIGFILMALSSVVDGGDPWHDTVELIWFPTGGGKTEAYLGLATFVMLYERICHGEQASGVQVLMRYTLRLLTAQQLQRASTLICALESLREKHEIPGGKFGIGLWVGGETTPNNGKNAVTAYQKLKKEHHAANPFLFDRCPWCAAQMGSIPKNKGSGNNVYGYKEENGTVKLHCPDKSCYFTDGLPVYLIDSDIYDKKPSLVIGTVDKFAMLAWKPEIRSLFGIDAQGNREINPPSLIIQDELHLISGPLGSMVGLYEPLIEELCTDHRAASAQLPKIICATATTRRYKEQVEALYGRDNTRLFPPPALDAEDSFFAVYHRDAENNELSPGRKYVGINAPGLGSQMSVQVRAFSALLDASNHLRPSDRDAWRTLLVFYNSIRELGGGKTLFQSDIPEQLNAVANRSELTHLRRFINNDQELTSRLKAEEVPQSIAKLQKELDEIKKEEIIIALKSMQEKLDDSALEQERCDWLAKIQTEEFPLEGYCFLVKCSRLFGDYHSEKESVRNFVSFR